MSKVSESLFDEVDPFELPEWKQAGRMVGAPPKPASGYLTCSSAWLARMLPRVRSPKQLAVLLVIYRRCLLARNQTVSLPNSDFSRIGVSRYGKYDAITALEDLGLITVGARDGKTVRVMLLDFP